MFIRERYNPQKIPNSLGRQGRLGKTIPVYIPKEQEAERIISHYLRKAGTCDGLDENSIVRLLSNQTCATLESVISYAAMKAAYKRQNKVSMENIVDACLELVYDAPASSYKLSEEATRKVAYHEAAHAVVSELLDPGSVNIISVRENYGKHGFVIYYRPNEKINCSVSYHENMIKTSLAGKAATELVFGETDMGTDSDLENAYRRAKELVDDKCMFGFKSWSDIDFINTYATEEKTRAVGMLLEMYYLETKRLLAEHRGLLDMMASELISRSTLLYSDVQRICSCIH